MLFALFMSFLPLGSWLLQSANVVSQELAQLQAALGLSSLATQLTGQLSPHRALKAYLDLATERLHLGLE